DDEGNSSAPCAEERAQPQPGEAAWNPPRHRGGQRQGRRGQVHRQRQSRVRAPTDWGPDRARGRGHSRPEHSWHAGTSGRSAARDHPGPQDRPRRSPHNLKVMSMGMLTGDDTPAILRGPMVGKYLNMFIGAVQWGHLDCLLLDLPPGTGDTQLTLAQSYPLSGAIIVTTPQDVSLKIARRGLRMFET